MENINKFLKELVLSALEETIEDYYGKSELDDPCYDLELLTSHIVSRISEHTEILTL